MLFFYKSIYKITFWRGDIIDIDYNMNETVTLDVHKEVKQN